MRYRSGTHNTGAGPHVNPDYYTPDGSREAGPVEQQMHDEMLGAWRRDGQPRTDWAWDVGGSKAVGRNAGRYNNRRY